jgi:SAM-dependent methyltransferase
MENKCPICASTQTQEQASYRNNHPSFKNLKRFSCSECELHFANPMPSKFELESYNNDYHNIAHGGKERNLKAEAFFIGLAKTRLHFIEQEVPLNSLNSYTVIEIGPGPGVFASIWLDRFPKTNYLAIETDQSCHSELKKIGVTLIEYVDIVKFEKKVDFMIMSHVLEHVTEPIDFLKYLIKGLKPNAHMFIEVPCNDWQHKFLDEPHVLFFDKNPMRKLLELLSVKIIRIKYYGSTIKQLKNKTSIFIKRVRSYFFKKNINYFHPEKKNLIKMGMNELQANAILNFSAHLEQKEPAWWLRVIFKK